ncbi:uncharacterized protein BJ212DRAFT_1311086 [Suillus subaureus]|uniref:Uncharacterized protein n=1 Tax=Suillus subaureus TaxID=48587 RepID=A0A9P7JK94_9AGAM|nr:uncharacterized protein BJ212DRAFT_1311086 [Suillus subaureus]KAG1827233.1 hypothetical protein BJ212DRAFT_1311086 [Suillus subaureus]
MDPVFITAGFVTLVIVYGVYCRYSHISLADVPGPESASFIMGMSILSLAGSHC